MEKNMFLAFLLNLAFSAFELAGSLFTGSVAIASDALHDLGDAVSIGISCLFEKKSNRQPDEEYTYGYRRYSVLGGLLSTLVLMIGSVIVILNAILRILDPVTIHYNSMIGFAVVGVLVNACAAYFTREGESVNQKAVNLHMLEDVLGWAVVLLGAIVMKFSNWWLIDPIMSIGVAVFLLVHATKNLKNAVDLLLEKTPQGIQKEAIRQLILETEGVTDVHHIHLWSLDGINHYATMHIVTNQNPHEMKETIRRILQKNGIGHATLELETEQEHCHEEHCSITQTPHHCHHHHH